MIRQFFDNFSNKNGFKYYFRSDKKEEEKNWNKGETVELYAMKRKGRLLDIEIDRLAAHVICLWSFHGRSASIYEEYTLKSLFYTYIFSTWIERLTRNDQKSFDFLVYTFRSYFCYEHGKYFLNNKNNKKNREFNKYIIRINILKLVMIRKMLLNIIYFMSIIEKRKLI